MIDGDSSENKRKANRWRVRLPCRFVSAGESHPAMMTDLSSGGAFIESEYYPLSDTAATLYILIGTREISIGGMVRHGGWFLFRDRNANGFGFEFENLSGQALLFVEKVLTRLNDPAERKTALEL